MSDDLRLCPSCHEGHMRSISTVDEVGGSIKFFECDNEFCKYRSAETEISQDTGTGEESNELIMCSKCHITFNTQLGYKQHYDEKHKPEGMD